MWQGRWNRARLAAGAGVLVALMGLPPQGCRTQRPAPEAPAEKPTPRGESPSPTTGQQPAPPSTARATPPRIPPAQLAGSPVDQTMRLHLLDVGQGSALLMEFPCAAMLVDTGGESNDAFDSQVALRTQLEAFFQRRADLHRTLDLVVITHPHLDHVRGIPVLGEFTVKVLVDNGQPGDELVAEYMAAWKGLVATGATHRSVSAEDVPAGGLSDATLDPIACPGVDPTVRVLWGGVQNDPGWRGSGEFDAKPFNNANNHSVVLRVDFGETSTLITGDLEAVAIADLLAKHEGTRVLDVDIYVVGHHGSANGTTRALMEAVRPKLALMSMGPASRHLKWTAYQYGHPRAAAVDTVMDALVLPRAAVEVPVGAGMKRFNGRVVDRALYATGWDGAVVVETDVAGHLAVDAVGWHAKPAETP